MVPPLLFASLSYDQTVLKEETGRFLRLRVNGGGFMYVGMMIAAVAGCATCLSSYTVEYAQMIKSRVL